MLNMRSQRDDDKRRIKECVLKHGVSVETKTIAQELGVTEKQLFERHGSKTYIMAESLGYDHMLPMISTVQAGPTAAPLDEQLNQIATWLIPFYLEILPSTIALWSASSVVYSETKTPPSDPRDLNPSVMARQLLAAWFKRAQAQGRLGPFDANSAAIMFMACCQAPAIRFHIGEDMVDLDQYQPDFISTFLRGVQLSTDDPR